MNNKENELIFEQYVKPRNVNKRPGVAIVEALDHVMRLPRVKRHGKTLVEKTDILNVLDKLANLNHDPSTGKPQVPLSKRNPELQKKLDAYKDNGMWNPDQDESWNLNPDEYPKKSPGQSQDDQPADDQAKLDADTVTKLQDATDENGQINILDALRIIGGFQEDK